MKLENIYIESDDDVSMVVERILNTQSDNVVLFIPEQAKISETILNLRLLYREARAAKKKIFLSTEEEEVAAMAEEVGIPVMKYKAPIKPASRGPSFIRDIAPPPKNKGERMMGGVKKDEAERQLEKSEAPVVPKKNLDKRSASSRRWFNIQEEDSKKKSAPRKAKRHWRLPKGFLFVGLGIIIVLVLGAIGVYMFSSAEVQIITKKTVWQNQSAVLALKNLDEVDQDNFKIPAEYLKFSRQASQDFLATGLKDVKVKSSGKIKIFNAYSSTPQNLIVNTRFLSQSGKIFRLTAGVTVPGAKVEAGKIIPSFIEVKVVADQPGAEYNIDPTHFTIPGFQGTPKYDKFYADFSEAMTGGYVGQAKVISQEDLNQAKSQLTELAQVSLEEEFQSKFPQGFKVLNEAKSFSVEKIVFSGLVGDQMETFRGSVTASLKAIAFRESDIKAVFLASASKSDSALAEKELFSGDFQYGMPRVDFEKGMISFPVSVTLVFRDKIEVGDFPAELAGMNEKQFQKFFASLPGIENGVIKVKPSFLNFLPLNVKNIKIVLDPVFN